MSLSRELGLALRRLRRQPSFTATAVGTLALGIAAPTALFAIVNATLLRPLPYLRPQEIYTVRTTMTDGRFTIGSLASEEMNSLTRATSDIQSAAMTIRGDDAIVAGGTATQVARYLVSEHFFDLFGVPMERGRALSPDEFGPRPVPSVVLSHRVWQSVFGGDPQMVGRTIQMNSGAPALVVGIAPPTFDVPRGADVWVAGTFAETIGHGYDAFVRLKSGRSPASIQAPMTRVMDDLAVKYPDMEKNRIFVLRSLLDATVGNVGPTVVIAFAATGLLLVLAVVNVVNLLLAQATTRARELAVRTALGASRWNLLQPLLAESLLLSAASAVAGMGLAYAGVRGIVALGGTALPRVEGMRLEPEVFLFTAVVMIAATLIIGIAPALLVARRRLTDRLNEGGRAGLQGRATRRVLGAMIVAEVTIAIALVAGAGRLLVSLQHLLAVDPGFTAQGRLAIDVNLPRRRYADAAQIDAWSQQVSEGLRALGATHVAEASSLPFHHEWDSTFFVDIVGHPTDPQHRPNGRQRIVSRDFFRTLGIRLLAGREFGPEDRREGEPVVIVSEAWLRRFLDGADPLQTHVITGFFGRLDGQTFVPLPAAIVGVVSDVQYADLVTDAEPVVYFVEAQVPFARRSVIVTTADGHPERLMPQIRTLFAKIDSNVPVEAGLMTDARPASLTWSSLGLLLMGTFGIAAIVLAGTGILGVIAFVVSQRAGEMAVRLALGATPAGVFRVVMLQGARLVVAGLAIGGLLSWWTGQLMNRYLFHVSPASLPVLAGSAALVLVVSLAATALPARRAAGVQPSRVLRS